MNHSELSISEFAEPTSCALWISSIPLSIEADTTLQLIHTFPLKANCHSHTEKVTFWRTWINQITNSSKKNSFALSSFTVSNWNFSVLWVDIGEGSHLLINFSRRAWERKDNSQINLTNTCFLLSLLELFIWFVLPLVSMLTLVQWKDSVYLYQTRVLLWDQTRWIDDSLYCVEE